MPEGDDWVSGRCRGVGLSVVDADAGWRTLFGPGDLSSLDALRGTSLGRELISAAVVDCAAGGVSEIVVEACTTDVGGVHRSFLVVLAPERSSGAAWSMCVIESGRRAPAAPEPVATGTVSPLADLSAARALGVVQALDDADFAVVVQDLGGTLTYLNAAGARMYGWTPEAAIGRHITEVVGDVDQAMFDELTRRLDRKGSWTGRVENVDRAGRRFPVALHVAIVRDDEGQPMSRLSIATDISDVVLTERRAARLEKLDSLGHLAGGITHDFNNLLTIILGGAEMLSAELRDDPRLGPLADMLVKAALGGADLTNRLLVFASRQSLQPDVLAPDLVVAEMLPLLRRALDADIDVTLHCIGSWSVLADRGQLEVALMNIAVNARDAMKHGGRLSIETADVTIGPADEHGSVVGDFVRIAVADTGVGMSTDVLEHALEPFFTTKLVGAGSGLGLSMVHGFVQQSSGFVELRSERGVGTTVELYLPRADGHRAPLSVADEQPVGGVVTGSVLVVDDDDLVRQHAAASISELGYEVMQASSGQDALDLLRDGRHVDLLFTDVSMPGGMSGVELAAAVRTVRPGVAVVLTSGRIDADVGIDPSERLLRKPYRAHELAEVLRTALAPPR